MTMKKQACGFTLVEMTIVFVIISLVLGMGMNVFIAQMNNARLSETKSKEEAIKQALISFIARNNRLPCPADPTLTAGTALYGEESATPGTCTGVASSGTSTAVVVSGIVPWMSIGLSEEMATDGYFARFSYTVMQAATKTNQNAAGLRGYITIHSAGPGTPKAAPTGNQINDCSAGLAYNPCAAVAVVVSHGKNGFGAYLPGGNRTPTTGASTNELANADGDNQFVKHDYSEAAGAAFDDVLLAMTPSDLLSPLTQNGTLKDYRASLANTFASMRGGIDAFIIASRTPAGAPSGSGSFFVPTGLPSGVSGTDPWGNAISYSAGPAPSISTGSASSSIAYTLISFGPDGTSGGSDDIAQSVTVGEMQSILARYF